MKNFRLFFIFTFILIFTFTFSLSLHGQATEHVIGNVRCAPGCFSLFRASAIRENKSTDQKAPSVIDMYSTVTKRYHHLPSCWIIPPRLQEIGVSKHCLLDSFFLFQRTWMPCLWSRWRPLALYDDHTGLNLSMAWLLESRETKILTKPFNPARLEDPVLCSGRRLHPVPWGTFGVPEATTTMDCVR